MESERGSRLLLRRVFFTRTGFHFARKRSGGDHPVSLRELAHWPIIACAWPLGAGDIGFYCNHFGSRVNAPFGLMGPGFSPGRQRMCGAVHILSLQGARDKIAKQFCAEATKQSIAPRLR